MKKISKLYKKRQENHPGGLPLIVLVAVMVVVVVVDVVADVAAWTNGMFPVQVG